MHAEDCYAKTQTMRDKTEAYKIITSTKYYQRKLTAALFLFHSKRKEATITKR